MATTPVLAFCTILVCVVAYPQIRIVQTKPQIDIEETNQHVKLTQDLNLAQDQLDKDGVILNLDRKTLLENKDMPVFTNVALQDENDVPMTPEKKVFKREVKKKPKKKKTKNSKKRKNMEKLKMQKESEDSSSKSDKKSKKSKSDDTDESETAPESSDSSKEESSSCEDSGYQSDDEGSDDSDSDDKTKSTEEISLTESSEESSESESSEVIDSGPDSSPPASSDSTDESSASKAISGGSSEVSYTLSSSASVYSSSEESDSESESESKDKSKSGKSKEDKTSKSKEKKSQEKSKSAEPKVTTKVKKKKGKKVTEIKIKMDKNGNKVLTDLHNKDSIKRTSKENVKREGIDVKSETKGKTEVNVKDKFVAEQKVGEVEKKLNTERVEDTKVTKKKLELSDKISQHIKTNEVPSMAKFSGKRMSVNQPNELKNSPPAVAPISRPGLEMLKVKKAEVDPKKKNDLQHELLKDYPGSNETVEIVNWEGTFAPIVGEPYVAPIDHQPDSFWDAIYRSTDPDLPTPPGVDVSDSDETAHPDGAPTPDPLTRDMQHFTHSAGKIKVSANKNGDDLKEPDGMQTKTKDKGKKEKKKPKLSPKQKKEKKKKKKEDKEEREGVGRIKASAHTNGEDLKNNGHLLPQQAAHMMGPKSNNGPHVDHIPVNLHAAGKSEEILKTPSEEERESGTTYKPEGAYEYPSFRHPDFNPDTAYDENGIPIHESPGWTPPPTLPGDHRFGKEKSRPGAGLSDRSHGPLARPSVAHDTKMESKKVETFGHGHVPTLQPQSFQHNANNHIVQGLQHPHDMHANTAAQEHLHVVESMKGAHMEHQQDHGLQHPHDIHANMAAQEHQHVLESLKGAHVDHELGHVNGLVHSPLHLAEPHVSDPKEHHETPLILPAQLQRTIVEKNAGQHKIHKRKVDSVESHESLSRIMTTQELNAAAKTYRDEEAAKDIKAYKLTDEELLNKENSAPMEAINPALYMHRNMMHVKKKKKQLNSLPKISDSDEVIAVIVGSKNGVSMQNLEKMGIKKIHKIVKSPPKRPVVYSAKNEAVNPLLYKHRNLFKASDMKDDGAKVKNDMMKQMLLQKAQQQDNTKAVPIEEFLKGPHGLRGRGRENFNPVFINPNKMLHVNTNKFKPAAPENHVVKREVKDSFNPVLYSYQNMFGNNPKQVLPVGKNNQMLEKTENTNVAKPRGTLFGGGVPVIDSISEEKEPTQYMGKTKEALNPFLVNFPNMFKANYGRPAKNQAQEFQKEIPAAPKRPLKKPMDPSVRQYFGRDKENHNPYLYSYSNMFAVNNKADNEEKPVGNTRGLNSRGYHKLNHVSSPLGKQAVHTVKKREAKDESSKEAEKPVAG